MPAVEPFENGTVISKLVKYLVSTAYVLSPLAYIGYALYMGVQIDMVIWMIAIGFSVASAYTIFGQAQTEEAIDQVQELQDSDDNA